MLSKQIIEEYKDKVIKRGCYSSDDTLVLELVTAVEKMRSALEHPDYQELSCECGSFEGTDNEEIWHTCVRCSAKDTLTEIFGDTSTDGEE